MYQSWLTAFICDLIISWFSLLKGNFVFGADLQFMTIRIVKMTAVIEDSLAIRGCQIVTNIMLGDEIEVLVNYFASCSLEISH